MSERLRSVGLDIGTTSTQMVLSELTIENRASSFAVPDMEITDRKLLYKSPIHFTPLLDEDHMDADALREIVEEEYRLAGITRETVDSGAVIITGETSRRENARAVLRALSELAGDFVVAAAGPDLESTLAAKGAGAVSWSEKTGQTVLHMDIGGGTSNLALIENGVITRTGCLNVGGRLLKFRSDGALSYVSPVLAPIFAGKPGDIPANEQLQALAQTLTHALEMAAGLRPPTDLLAQLTTLEAARPWVPPDAPPMLSFSGGVADCIANHHPPLAFGDIGPILGQAIRNSRLCRGEYRCTGDAIRATVIGAGCHSARLSGSTVFCQNVPFPLKNLPVSREPGGILAMEGLCAPTYAQIAGLAAQLITQGKPPYYICLEQDMAKALGQALAARLPPETSILCIDRIRAAEGSFLDIAAPIGGALPVVIKTLILSDNVRSTL